MKSLGGFAERVISPASWKVKRKEIGSKQQAVGRDSTGWGGGMTAVKGWSETKKLEEAVGQGKKENFKNKEGVRLLKQRGKSKQTGTGYALKGRLRY